MEAQHYSSETAYGPDYSASNSETHMYFQLFMCKYNDNLLPESHKYTISHCTASGRKTDKEVIIYTLDLDYIEGVVHSIYLFF